MSLFDSPPHATVWRDRLALVLQAASLALTGWVLWGARLAAGWPHLSISTLILRSAVYAAGAWAAGAAITLVLYLGAMQWEREDVIRATLRTSSAAVWFAPSVILLTQLSPAALAAATVLVVHATRALYHEWRVQNPPLPPEAAPRGLFAAVELPQTNFWRDVAPGLAASFSVQLGVAAVILRQHVLAGLAFAMSVSLATVLAMTSRAIPRKPAETLPRTAFGVLLTVVLAIGLTVAGMLPQWARGLGDGSGTGLGAGAGVAGSPKSSPRGGGSGLPDLPGATDAAFADGGFPGVILWPEVKPYATLIAPMPQTAGGLATVEARPMSIPFSGEYWMFRWPFARPPRTSLFQRGNPANLSFKTTDHRPLQMEARHKLDQPIALACCARIQIEIRNADRFPNTIELELVLIDNDRPGAPWVSLGREIVGSRPDLSKDPVLPVAETLDFTVAAGSRIESFNEFKIVFYRDRRRMDQSAKVGIERFVLLPRL